MKTLTVTRNNILMQNLDLCILFFIPSYFTHALRILMNSLYFKSWQASDADRKGFMSARNFEANTWVGLISRQNYSRLSLFRLSEVRPPRYTGHLAWHGMLAICLLHKTQPEVRPLAIPASAGCPKLDFHAM